MQIHWKLKSLLFALFDVIGERPLYWVQKYVTRRSRLFIPEIPEAWRFHAATIEAHDSRRLIEFGAGKNLAQNLYLSRAGLSQTVVDLKFMLDLSQVNDAIRILHELGALEPAPAVESREALEAAYAIAYRAPFDMRDTGFPAGSYDVCVSTDTLEHIPRDAIRAILAELRRILAPGGVVSAAIDYSDHYSHTDVHISPLNYLRFSERAWQRHNHDCHFQNRLRHRHYGQLFTEAGFAVLQERAADFSPDVPPDLRAELLTGDRTDTALTGYWVLQNP